MKENSQKDPFVEYGEKKIMEELIFPILDEDEETSRIDLSTLDKKYFKYKDNYPYLTKIKIIGDLLYYKKDLERELEDELIYELLENINEIIRHNNLLKKKFNFDYFDCINRYSNPDDIYNLLFN